MKYNERQTKIENHRESSKMIINKLNIEISKLNIFLIIVLVLEYILFINWIALTERGRIVIRLLEYIVTQN